MALLGDDARDDILGVLSAERGDAWRSDRAALWPWQFAHNPHGDGRARFIAAVRGAEVVGVNGVMPVRARVGNALVSGAWKLDLAVLPRARRLGLAAEIVSRIPRLADVSVVFGSAPASVRILRRLGWRPGAAVGAWSLPLRVRAPRDVLRVVRSAAIGALYRVSGATAFDVCVGEWPTDQALDALWASVRAGYACAVERDARYLRWKYRHHPALAYLPVSAWRGGRLAGLFIARPAPDLAVVADWVGPSGDMDLLTTLLREVVRSLDDRGARSVYLETSAPAIALACRELGFGAVDGPPLMHVWPGSARVEGPWFVMTGDSDGDLLHGCGAWKLPAAPTHFGGADLGTPAPLPAVAPRAEPAPRASVSRALRAALVAPQMVRALRWTTRGRAAVFMLHRFVGAEGAPPEHDAEALRRTLEALRRSRIRVLQVDELLRGLREGDRTVDGAVALTIDDGYADILDVAAPVFEAMETPYSVFLATEFVDGGRWFWWDKLEFAFCRAGRRALTTLGCTARWDDTPTSREHGLARMRPLLRALDDASRARELAAICERLEVDVPSVPPPGYHPLKWEEIRALERGGLARFGPHTHGHPNLSREPLGRAREEIVHGAERLRREVARPLEVFCYPYGHRDAFGPREEALVEELGFAAALAAEHGTFTREDVRSSRRFALPRVAWRDDTQYVLRVASGSQRALDALDAPRGF